MCQRPTTTERQGPEPAVAVAAADGRAGGHRAGWAQLAASLVCLVTAVWMLSWDGLQGIEAASASWFLRRMGAGGEAIGSTLLVVDSTRRNPIGVPPGGYVSAGFEIAPSCSVSMFLAALLAAAAILFGTGRVAVRRAAPVLAAVAAFFVVVSQVRLVFSGELVHRLGQADGYPIAHVLVGTVISTLGLVVGLVAFVMLALRAATNPPSSDPPSLAPFRPAQSPNQ